MVNGTSCMSSSVCPVFLTALHPVPLKWSKKLPVKCVPLHFSGRNKAAGFAGFTLDCCQSIDTKLSVKQGQLSSSHRLRFYSRIVSLGPSQGQPKRKLLPMKRSRKPAGAEEVPQGPRRSVTIPIATRTHMRLVLWKCVALERVIHADQKSRPSVG